MEKKILEVKALIGDSVDRVKYREELSDLYKKLTDNEYHVIVLFNDQQGLMHEELMNYPKLKVL